jgi:hypothetical protein
VWVSGWFYGTLGNKKQLDWGEDFGSGRMKDIGLFLM